MRAMAAALFVACAADVAQAGDTTKVVVVDGAEPAAAVLAKSAAAGEGFAADLGKDFTGSLLAAAPERPLAPGRYRLHVPLALAPLGDVKTGGLQVNVLAGQTQRRFHALHFEEPGKFIDATLDFTVAAPAVDPAAPSDAKPVPFPITVNWTLPNDKKNKFERDKTIVTPAEPDLSIGDKRSGPSLDDLSSAMAAPKISREGQVPLAEAGRLPASIAMRPPVIERMSPIALVSVRASKAVYKPGEPGAATAVFRNVGDRAASAEIAVELTKGLGEPKSLHTEKRTIEAGATWTWTGPIDLAGMRWGGQVSARAAAAGMTGDAGSDCFAVTDNFFEVACVTGQPGIGKRFDDPAAARAFVTLLRDQGFTAFEAFFWAPCDMFKFTPETEVFFGGQHGYSATITSTRNLIAAAHEQGLSATVYANFFGGSSVPAMELMRKRPEWFGNAEYRAAIVDDFDLMAKGKLGGALFWSHNQLNLPPPDAAFKLHAQELIASHKQFGWDATRYDSFYPLTQEWMKPALAMVRRMVEAEAPGYRWAYNSIPSRDYRAGAIEGMLSGGGLIMEEALSQGFGGAPPIGGVADQLMLLRHIVWTFGGHNGTIYRKPREAPFTPLDDIYASSAYLAAGAHPYYTPLEGEMGKHNRFALRYGEFLFNNKLAPLPNAKDVVQLGSADRFLHWDRFARSIDLGGTGRRIVLHLFNARGEHRLGASPEMKRPPTLENVPIALDLPPGSRLRGAWSLCPVPEPGHQALPAAMEGTRVTLTVPRVRFWNVVVVDWDSDQPLPAQKPAPPPEVKQ
ncbi:MAG: hypothetical protein NTW19_11310 [Planctomycetota bacterium]|nr:hypothetical protein [Planctomycetota bacterium]